MIGPSPRVKADHKSEPMHVAFKLFGVAERLEKSGIDWTAAEEIPPSVRGVFQASTDKNKRLFKQGG